MHITAYTLALLGLFLASHTGTSALPNPSPTLPADLVAREPLPPVKGGGGGAPAPAPKPNPPKPTPPPIEPIPMPPISPYPPPIYNSWYSYFSDLVSGVNSPPEPTPEPEPEPEPEPFPDPGDGDPGDGGDCPDPIPIDSWKKGRRDIKEC